MPIADPNKITLTNVDNIAPDPIKINENQTLNIASVISTNPNNVNTVLDANQFYTPEQMGMSVLFNNITPVETITKYIKGYKWEVDYYLQIRDMYDTIEKLDTNVTSSIQKYYKINKLIIRLQQPINQDNIDEIVGEAIVNAGFLPNTGDMILAQLTGGRIALFRVSFVDIRTYNIHKAYIIQFKLFSFVDTDQTMYRDIESKVMKSYTYDKEYLLNYSAPVLVTDDFERKKKLERVLESLVNYYFDNFIVYEKSVLGLYSNGLIYVDTYLNEYLYKIIDFSSNHRVSKIWRIQTNQNTNKIYTLWDYIYDRNPELINLIKPNMGFLPLFYNGINTLCKDMSYFGVDYTVQELAKDQNPNNPLYLRNLSIGYRNDFRNPIYETRFNQAMFNASLFGNSNPVTYIFSENFYNMNYGYLGLMESSIVDYVNGNQVVGYNLDLMINQYTQWSTIHQYYLIPMLITLIKDSIRFNYKSI